MTVLIFRSTLLPLADSVFGTWTQQVKGLGSSGAQMGVLLGHLPEQQTQTLYSLAQYGSYSLFWSVLVRTALVIRDRKPTSRPT